MNILKSLLLLALLFPSTSALAESGNIEPKSVQPKILVYGATASGVLAAIAAAESGAQVTLIEPSGHIGGMLTGGLSNTDVGNKKTIGGITHKFFHKIREHYKGKYTWQFEPHVASKILKQMLKDAGVKLKTNVSMGQVSLGLHQGKKVIESISLKDGSIQRASVFIDASYEGDLMAKAGVPYNISREGMAKYGESMAGFRGADPKTHPKKHRFPPGISANSVTGKPLPGVNPYIRKPKGAPDENILAYTYRACLSKQKDNQTLLTPPRVYNPGQYALLAAYLKKLEDPKLKDIFSLTPIPGKKFELNSRGPFSTDFIGESSKYPDAADGLRKSIALAHEEYIKGLFKFLLTDKHVPKSIKSELAQYGLCKDEFTDNNNWPKQLYIKAARRMIGDYIISEKDIINPKSQPDPVAIASRPIELRHTQRLALKDGSVMNEGHKTVFIPPWQIPYRSLTPRIEDCSNLLVPVAVSASYVAYNSLRMEPVYMMLGESAGVAAALAAKRRNQL